MPKRTVSCTVDSDVLDLSELNGINRSQILEDALRDALDITGQNLNEILFKQREALLKAKLSALYDNNKIKKTQNKKYGDQQKADKTTIDKHIKGLLENKKKSTKTGPGKFVLNKRVHLKLLNERLYKNLKIPEFEAILVKWGFLDG